MNRANAEVTAVIGSTTRTGIHRQLRRAVEAADGLSQKRRNASSGATFGTRGTDGARSSRITKSSTRRTFRAEAWVGV